MTGDTPGDVVGGHRAAVPEAVAAPSVVGTDLLADLAIGGGCSCVACGSDRGVFRPELPLAALAMVCDRCWAHVGGDFCDDDAEAVAVA